MPPTRQRVLTPIAHMVLQSAGELGVDRAHLLSVGGLTERDLHNRDGYVDLDKLVAVGREFMHLRPGINIGLAVLNFLQPSNLGVLGYVLQHSPTLHSALTAFARYQSLLSDAVSWRVRTESATAVGPGDAIVTVESAPLFEELGFPLETQVGAWVRIGRVLTGVSWAPRQISFCHRALGDEAEFEQVFQCPVRFASDRNELVVPADALSLPVLGAQQVLRPSFVQLAETRLAALPGSDRRGATHGRLFALLLERLPSGLTNRDEAARALGMSQRTLSRRLSEDGTSFRAVLEEVRMELAEAWLDNPENAIYEVAYLLGYSEPSTFHRSFRRWTGHTPQVWRQRRADIGQSNEHR